MTDTAAARPLWRERLAILAALLALAAAAWAVLIGQSGSHAAMGGGLTMGMGAPLFLALWVAMMVAMMFPTAAPMVLMFARVSADRSARGDAFVPTWVFVGAYLAVWTLFGAAAYLLAAVAQGAAESSPWLTANGARVGGALIALAGLYQLTPLKQLCLTKCRSPLSFVMTSWREGHAGALRMGFEHGAYCLGCCWMLFLLLFPLGIMNVAAMAAITLLIFAEKSLPLGQRASQVAALGLVLYGLAVLAVPDLLPTAMGTMPMGSDAGGTGQPAPSAGQPTPATKDMAPMKGM